MDEASRTRLVVPNTLTAASIVVGFMAMVAAADGRFELGVYLMLLSFVLDMCDGRIARWLKATSKFGQEMDSFSDSLSFCAAPAFLVYLAILQPLGGIGVGISVLYLLSGIFRLARFNLTADVHEKATHTNGLPTPIAAAYLMATVLMRDRISPSVAAVVVLVMAILMISRIRLPEMQGKSAVSFVLMGGLLSYCAFVVWPHWYTIIWWNFWNVVIILVAKGQARRLEKLESST